MTPAALSVPGLDVSRETLAALHQLQQDILRWNARINLVSQGSATDLWDRHVRDSAQLFNCAPKAWTHWVDLGSGGGFPGLVLAVLAAELRPDARFTFVESDKRKASVLNIMGQCLSKPPTVVAGRVEALAPLEADVLTARALAPLPELCAMASRHLRPDGTAIFPKGANFRAELEAAGQSWHFTLEQRSSITDAAARILLLTRIKPR